MYILNAMNVCTMCIYIYIVFSLSQTNVDEPYCAWGKGILVAISRKIPMFDKPKDVYPLRI